jgi:hypothetical protein
MDEAADSRTREETEDFVRAHRSWMTAAGQQLLALFPNNARPNACYVVEPLQGDRMRARDELSPKALEFDSPECRVLLEDGTVVSITVCKGVVRFSCGGAGIAPASTYYDACYVPSDDMGLCFGYSDQMEFTRKDGGMLGEIPGSDDTFFCLPLGDHLYFCVSTF